MSKEKWGMYFALLPLYIKTIFSIEELGTTGKRRKTLSFRSASRYQIGINELVEVSIHHGIHVA